MKRITVFLMIAGLTTTFVFGQKRETRSVSNFTGINASGTFDITVAKGDTESLTVEAGDEVLPYVRSEVKDGVLELHMDKNAPRKVRNKLHNLQAFVVMKDLDHISLLGACTITVNELFTPKSFTGICNGSCTMAINVNTGQLSIKARGDGKMQIKAIVTGDTQINVSGSPNIQGELKTEKMKFISRGACKVDVSGSATDIIIDMSGSSNFDGGNFVVKTATVISSGSNKITVHATDDLNVNLSSASTVNYKGSPAITIKSNGGSNVNQI